MAGQPLRLTLGLAWYLIKNKLRRRQRFPLTIADPGPGEPGAQHRLADRLGSLRPTGT